MSHQVETRTVEADEAGMRIDRWFRHHFPDVGFGHLQKLLRSGQIRVNGGRVKPSTRLDPGQAVRIPPMGPPDGGPSTGPDVQRPSNGSGERASDGDKAPPARSARARGPRDELRDALIYEDDVVFVFNKPAGLAVQGGSGLTKHVDGLLEAWRDAKGQKPRLVHRIDRETSGVLVVARTRLAASKLAGAFRARSARKVYWALVAGVPKPRQGRISTWLARDEKAERMRIAEHGDDEASHAVSLYSVVDQVASKLSWLTMRPVTGRTHQLRAHAAHIGHPIVGDPLYFAIRDWDLPGGIQDRLHLHARRLMLPHPDGGVLDVSAPLPPHMVQSWNLLGFSAQLGDPALDAVEDVA